MKYTRARHYLVAQPLMLHPPLKKMIVKDDMVFTGKNDRENKACRDNCRFF